jgi:hypothetical protein
MSFFFFNPQNRGERFCGLYLLLKKSPRHAVCSAVLNLLSQVGFRLRSSALAEAYRVTAADVKPYKQVLAQNRSCGITRTAGYLFYTII